MRELDRCDADAAGAAMHQGDLALRQPADLKQVRPNGERRLRQRRRSDRVVARRPRQALRRRRNAIRGIPAAVGQCADLISDGQRRHLLAGSDDLARHLQSQDRAGAGRRRIGPLPLRNIRPVHPRRLHADQHLVRPWHRHRTGGQTEHLRPSGAVGLDVWHGLGDRHGREPPVWMLPESRRVMARGKAGISKPPNAEIRGRRKRVTKQSSGVFRSASAKESDDPARFILPVTVAKNALIQLARRKPRQLGLEIDRPRDFLPRKMLPAER